MTTPHIIVVVAPDGTSRPLGLEHPPLGLVYLSSTQAALAALDYQPKDGERLETEPIGPRGVRQIVRPRHTTRAERAGLR